MAGQIKNSNRKRSLEAEQKPMAKRQKREQSIKSTNNGVDAEEAAPAPITDICNELIDRIFDFLDVSSLLNVAGTCKRLQIAAVAKFGQKFGKTCFRLVEHHNAPIGVFEFDIDTAVIGLKYTLPFLRCFGGEIRNLGLRCRHTSAGIKQMHLYRYIQQYCADTVTSLNFEISTPDNATFPVELFANAKPFRSVEKVYTTGGHLGKNLTNFAKWFPNLRDLDIFGVNTIDGSATGVSCPHLKHLSVRLTNSSKQFSTRSATKLLHANPQLKSVKISLETKKDFGPLTKMFDKNTRLSKLKINGSVKGVNAAVLNRLTKMHQSLMELDLSGCTTFVDDAIIFSQELKSLQLLRFSLRSPNECNHLTKKCYEALVRKSAVEECENQVGKQQGLGTTDKNVRQEYTHIKIEDRWLLAYWLTQRCECCRADSTDQNVSIVDGTKLRVGVKPSLRMPSTLARNANHCSYLRFHSDDPTNAPI